MSADPADDAKHAERVGHLLREYAEGCRNADADRVGRVFTADARMTGWLGAEYVSAPVSDFLAVVRDSAPNAPLDQYAWSIQAVEVRGRVASARLEETGYLGASFTNLFTAVRTAGGWRLAGKTFATN